MQVTNEEDVLNVNMNAGRDPPNDRLLTEVLDMHRSLTRTLDEDACLAGLCQTNINSGLCVDVHEGPINDVGDKSGFRLSMINDLHDDRLALLWQEDYERGRRRQAAKIGYFVSTAGLTMVIAIAFLLSTVVLGLSLDTKRAIFWALTTFFLLILQGSVTEPLKVLLLAVFWSMKRQNVPK